MQNISPLITSSPEVQSGMGKNIIPPPAKEPLWLGFLRKFADPLIIVLSIVFVFSVGVACYEIAYAGRGYETLLEPLGVLIAMLLATGVGFVFEVKADREFDILNQVKDSRKVRVLRRRSADAEPEIFEIKRQDVCLGDIVLLESGDEIPADGILLKASSLNIDESGFTGEPHQYKFPASEQAPDEAGVAYPTDFMLRSSTVIEGTGTMRITAIGMDTEEGKGAKAVEEGSDVQTPLNIQLSRLGKWISAASFVIGILVVVGRMVYFFGFDGDSANNSDPMAIIEFVLASLMIAVTLIVVAVPEGLPMSITVSLALSMRKMLSENNLVRRLHACETMGAATVICTDKTGTLTENRMTVTEEQWHCDKTLRCLSVSLNTTAELSEEDGILRVIGNPTEGALLRKLHLEGTDYREMRRQYDIAARQPFSTERKYMESTVKIGDSKTLRLVKGAPEIVMGMCNDFGGFGMRESAEATLSQYQRAAMRTLAFAAGEGESLTLVGIIGISDPVRSDVPAAIDTCTRRAGVRVIIVTGDTRLTAEEVARQIGLDMSGKCASVTGSEFAALSDEEALALLRTNELRVMSRARPADKARLVTLLQQLGEVVAVTGDGTNDAPALAKAQVGLSMGDGTARAKEASDITIIDNSFASINRAILWGRSLYQNIRRFIVFQVTVNVCACLMVLLGAFLGVESPLTVTQMLWVNLIMDTFAAMALSSLPADPRVMDEAPRSSRAHIVDSHMMRYTLLSGMMLFVLLAVLWAEGYHKIFFTTFVMLQFWNLFNVRYYRTDRSLIRDFADAIRGRQPLSAQFSRGFVFIAAAIVLGQVLIVEFGGEMFSVTPLSLEQWLSIVCGTSLVLIIPDLIRTCFGRSRG